VKLHIGYHPHLDAFWIVTFDEYMNENSFASNVLFSNYGSFVKDIFNTQITIQETAPQHEYYRTFMFS
jgi:hypothetical protein